MHNWRETLINLMEERGTNPRAVSIAIGKSPDYITKMLKRSNPTIEAFADLANHLNTDISTLYYGSSSDEQTNKLLKEFSHLDEKEKEFVLRMISGFSNE